MTKKNTKTSKWITALLIVGLCVGLAFFLFSGDNVTILKDLFNPNLTKTEVREALMQLGFKGYFTLGILSMLQVVLTFFPSGPVQMMAGVAFGVWRGALTCLAGVLLGNSIIYVLYRIYGDRLNEYFHTHAEFDFDLARKSTKIAVVICILYLLPAIPYGLICFFAAGLNLKYPKYIFLTTLGAIPSLLIGVCLGQMTMSTSWAMSVIVFIFLIVALILVYRYRSKIFEKVNRFMKEKLNYTSKVVVKDVKPFWIKTAAFVSRFIFDARLKLRLHNHVGKLEKPSIVLCNHGSFYDFVFAGRLLVNEKPRVVTARMYFYSKRLGTLLRKVGCFPKSMFTNDIENVRNCMRILTTNGTILMMPEARLSSVGKFEGIQDSTYKFIQKTGVAVYYIKVNGAFLAKPKWGKKMRKGANVEADLYPLFNAGETKTISLEELRRRVNEALHYDELAWLEAHPTYRYKSKTLAEGLENVLCVCPACKAKSSLLTKGRKIYCETCGFERYMDDRYAFTQAEPFKNFSEWHDWQTEELRNEIRQTPNYALTDTVELHHSCKGGKKILSFAGNGVCTLDKTGLTYRGTDNGEEIEKHFPLSVMYRILFGAGEDFEVYDGDEIYYFAPQNKRSCVTWYIVSGLLYEDNAK